jgi:hypothetical protein
MAGSSRQISPGIYEMRAYAGVDPITGKQRTISRRFKGTKRDMNKALAKFVTEVNEDEHATTKGTLGYLLERYIPELKRMGRAANTIESYEGYIQGNIIPAIGNVELRKLTPEILDHFYAQLQHQKAPSWWKPTPPRHMTWRPRPRRQSGNTTPSSPGH